jgi:ATP-dependent Clp protease ATP-binding subunit ClpC
VTLLAGNLVKRCEEQMAIHLKVTAPLKDFLVKKYCDIKMGARPLKRAMQTAVEDPLAEEILSGRIKSGDRVSAAVAKDKVVFKTKNE